MVYIMIRKFIETMQDLLIILINHLPLLGLGITVMGLFGQEQHYIWLWGAAVAVPLVLYFARVKIGNFFLFFALHLILPVIAFMVPVWILPKIILLVMVLIYVVWSVYIRLRSKTMGEGLLKPLFVISMLGALTLVENLNNKMGWEWIYIALAMVYLAGYFIYNFIDQYLHFLTVNESSAANIPEQEIFSSGMKQTFLFMLGSVVVLLLTANVGWLAYIMSWLGKGLLAVIRFLLSGRSGEQIEEIEPSVMESAPQDMGGMFAEEGKTALIWIILEKILMAAIGVLLIGLVVFGIVMGFRYLWKYFHAGSKKEDEVLQSGIDIRETCIIEKKQKEASDWFSFLKPREKVRKIYRKQILKHKKEIIGENTPENLEYMTAEECCEKISSEELKLIYEKARYSSEEITSEDVKRIKLSG